MNNKFITSFMVLLILLSSLMYVGTEIVSATEDNGTGLWFQDGLINHGSTYKFNEPA